MATTVTWTQDVDGNYEVSSPQHLKQLMNEGSLYTDAGTAPSSYWAAISYIQTADIDLLNDTTDIKPIGDSITKFSSDYDGGNYSISNWSYLDPNFASTDNCEEQVGVFGYSRSNVLKNIRLSGIFTIQGFHTFCGFLTGFAIYTDIYNIVCDFDVGTNITPGDATTSSSYPRIGCVCGYLREVTATDIDIKGTVDFTLGGNVLYAVGGFCGNMYVATASLVRLATTFPSGLSASRSGGIVGYLIDSTISDSINTMTGDIKGTVYTGGIVGDVHGTHSIKNVVNSMTGNIIASKSPGGGIMGESLSTGRYDALFNYMTGDISGVFKYDGGIVGQASSTSIVTNSINAMNGNVNQSVVGTGTVSTTVTVSFKLGETWSCPIHCHTCEFVRISGVRCKNKVCFGSPLCWIHNAMKYNVRAQKSTIPNAGKGLFATKKFKKTTGFVP